MLAMIQIYGQKGRPKNPLVGNLQSGKNKTKPKAKTNSYKPLQLTEQKIFLI